jgi:hypothetical protein
LTIVSFPHSCIVSAMTVLLSHMLTQTCQHYGHPLSVDDGFFVMQRT